MAEILYKEIFSLKWSSEKLKDEITKNISELEVKNKIVLIKVKGKLIGKRSNIDFGKFGLDISKEVPYCHLLISTICQQMKQGQ